MQRINVYINRIYIFLYAVVNNTKQAPQIAIKNETRLNCSIGILRMIFVNSPVIIAPPTLSMNVYLFRKEGSRIYESPPTTLPKIIHVRKFVNILMMRY